MEAMNRLEAAARVSAKAQVVIPKRVRERLGIAPGDLLLFEVREGELIVRRAPKPVADDPFAVFDEWAGAADAEAYEAF